MCEHRGIQRQSLSLYTIAIICILCTLLFPAPAMSGQLTLIVEDNGNGTVHVQVIGYFDTCCTPSCSDSGHVLIRRSGGANYNVCYAGGKGSAYCEATLDNCDLGYDSGGNAVFYAMGRDCNGNLPMQTQVYHPDRSINIDIISPSGTLSEPFDVVAQVTLPKTSKAYKGYVEARVSSPYGWNLPGMQCASENCLYSYQVLKGSLYDLYHGTNQSVMFGVSACGVSAYKTGTFSVDKTPAVSVASPEGKVSSPFDITGMATFKPSLNAVKGYITAKLNGYTVDTKQCYSESCSYSYLQNRGQPISYPSGGTYTASLVASVSGISVTRFKTFEVVPCYLQTGSVNAGSTTIDLSRGEAVNFAGNVTDGSGRPVNWSLSVAGRTFTGSGNSVAATWDGRDGSGKKVQPGTYTATLEASTAEGTCRSRKTMQVLVKESPKKGNLIACLDSSANLASGTLHHSQQLFTIPNSRISGEFNLYYSSHSGADRPLGTGWTHTYNIRLDKNNDDSYTLTEGNGSRTVLYRNGNYYNPDTSVYPLLTLRTGGGFLIEHKEGMHYQFDPSGKIVYLYDRNSNTISFTYAGENLASVTDPSGRTIMLAYDAGRISMITDPAGNSHSFTYTGQNLTSVSSQVAAVGTRVWVYTYDDRGFMHTKQDPLGNITSYAYDTSGRVSRVTDPEGRSRGLTYDPFAYQTQITEKDGGIWSYRYGSVIAGITEKIDPLENTTRYSYDIYGNITSTTDPMGSTTTYTYDVNGNVLMVTDPLGNTTTYTYNALNRVTGINYPGGATVAMAYDDRGNVTSITDPMGNRVQYVYDVRGNLTGFTNPLNQATLLTYDSYGYLGSVRGPAGGVISFAYDNPGNLIVRTDALGNSTSFSYNGLNKVRTIVDPLGHATSFTYDLNGNIATRTDANGRITNYRYNYKNRMTRVVDALGQVTELTYGTSCPACTGVDKLTSVTDPAGRTTIFDYDRAGRLIRETDPAGNYATYTYDAVGNTVTMIDANGYTTSYSHDALCRLTRISYPDGNRTSLNYDVMGNLTQAANEHIGYGFAYDLNNRLLYVTDSRGNILSYQYDAAGRQTGMSTPDGRTIGYNYDIGSRLSRITSTAGTFSFTYDLLNRRRGLAYPNGTNSFYNYDASGYLINLVNRDAAQNNLSFSSYNHDNTGNRVSMTDRAGSHEYGYDAIYQLVRAAHPDGSIEQFGYDRTGNRLGTSVDSANRLLEDSDFTYSYDRNGNLIRRDSKSNGENTTYIYDYENRLIRIDSTGTIALYKYDPLGRRIEKNVNGSITRYVYDGANMITEYDGSGGVKARYTHSLAIDDPLAIEKEGSSYFYHKDGLGSVTSLTDSSGSVVKTYTYQSFGQISAETGNLSQPFTFTGREFDSESGLYYYRSRYYDPRAGRFISKDPIGFKSGDVNLYRYVLNNPLKWIDPLGLWGSDLHSGIGNPNYGTYIWARQLGLSDQQARWVAIGNDGTDGGWASFMPIIGEQPRHFNRLSFSMNGFCDSRDYWASVEMDMAIQYYKEGDYRTAYGHLGKGMHSIQDKPSHRDWDPGWHGTNQHPEWYDVWNDPRNKTAREVTEKATKAYILYFLKMTGQGR